MAGGKPAKPKITKTQRSKASTVTFQSHEYRRAWPASWWTWPRVHEEPVPRCNNRRLNPHGGLREDFFLSRARTPAWPQGLSVAKASIATIPSLQDGSSGSDDQIWLAFKGGAQRPGLGQAPLQTSLSAGRKPLSWERPADFFQSPSLDKGACPDSLQFTEAHLTHRLLPTGSEDGAVPYGLHVLFW